MKSISSTTSIEPHILPGREVHVTKTDTNYKTGEVITTELDKQTFQSAEAVYTVQLMNENGEVVRDVKASNAIPVELGKSYITAIDRGLIRGLGRSYGDALGNFATNLTPSTNSYKYICLTKEEQEESGLVSLISTPILAYSDTKMAYSGSDENRGSISTGETYQYADGIEICARLVYNFDKSKANVSFNTLVLTDIDSFETTDYGLIPNVGYRGSLSPVDEFMTFNQNQGLSAGFGNIAPRTLDSPYRLFGSNCLRLNSDSTSPYHEFTHLYYLDFNPEDGSYKYFSLTGVDDKLANNKDGQNYLPCVVNKKPALIQVNQSTTNRFTIHVYNVDVDNESLVANTTATVDVSGLPVPANPYKLVNYVELEDCYYVLLASSSGTSATTSKALTVAKYSLDGVLQSYYLRDAKTYSWFSLNKITSFYRLNGVDYYVARPTNASKYHPTLHYYTLSTLKNGDTLKMTSKDSWTSSSTTSFINSIPCQVAPNSPYFVTLSASHSAYTTDAYFATITVVRNMGVFSRTKLPQTVVKTSDFTMKITYDIVLKRRSLIHHLGEYQPAATAANQDEKSSFLSRVASKIGL